jgi:hypothetical protein
MSIESWKAEFYPVPATQIVNESPLVQAEHAYIKWTGALKENLEKHELVKSLGSVNISDIAGNVFKFSTEECVWCHNYYALHSGACGRCPLYSYGVCSDPSGPFLHWFFSSDPQRMINAIQEILNGLRSTNERTYQDSV